MNGNRLSKPVLGSSEAKPVLISEVKKDWSALIAAGILFASVALISAWRKR